MEYTLSYTSAKEFYKSPAHYLLYKSGVKKETAALTFGSAFHESYHLLHYLAYECNLPLTFENQEWGAVMIEFIYTEIQKSFKSIMKAQAFSTPCEGELFSMYEHIMGSIGFTQWDKIAEEPVKINVDPYKSAWYGDSTNRGLPIITTPEALRILLPYSYTARWIMHILKREKTAKKEWLYSHFTVNVATKENSSHFEAVLKALSIIGSIEVSETAISYVKPIKQPFNP